MSTMAEQRYAARFRDAVTRIATGVVNSMRPEPRTGKVYSYDWQSQVAQILFPGETVENLQPARFALNLAPSRQMIDTFATDGYDAPGDIVRVAGKGSFYIESFISGVPRHSRYEVNTFTSGTVVYFPLPVMPTYDPFFQNQWIRANGQTLDGTDPIYNRLWNVYGNTFGGTDQTNFKVPIFSGLQENGIFTPGYTGAAGWTINNLTMVRAGNIITLSGSVTRTGANIVSPATGNIPNTDILTLTGYGLGSQVDSGLGSGSTGQMCNFVMSITGLLQVTATVANSNIATGDTITFAGTYISSVPEYTIAMIKL